ncbi:MAG: hypothetical protein ACREK8_00350, partial [Gemmatimonadales bacterium]
AAYDEQRHRGDLLVGSAAVGSAGSITMGMTPKVAFGALALAAVLLPLRKPNEATVEPPADDRSQRLLALVSQQHAAAETWSAIDVRDSALALIANSGAVGTAPQVAFRGFAPGLQDSSVDQEVSGLWRRIGHADSNVRTAVIVYNSEPYRFADYEGTFIDQRGGRTWCVAITSASQMRNGALRVWHTSLDRALAPCTFFAAFGVPGPAVGAWLANEGYLPIQSADWLSRPKGYASGEGPWERWYPENRGFDWPPLMRALGSLDFTSLITPPYEFGDAGLACVVGRTAACTHAVLGYTVHPLAGFPPDLVPRTRQPETVTLATVRPPVPSLVSAMVTDHDRASFQRFWSSSHPMEEAFQGAFGESLGAWTARWAQREWLASFRAKFGGPAIALGVTLNSTWPLLVIAWGGVALLIAATVARRRTA